MNGLYQTLNGQNEMMKRFNQFRSQFKGNPQQQIMQMLNNGQITQAQLNEAQQKASQLMSLFR